MSARPYDIITFDCYGTLIDWEGGIAGAFTRAVVGTGSRLDPHTVLAAYERIEPVVQAEAYRSYREVLTESARRVARELGWALPEARAGFLAESLPFWIPFPDTNAALERLFRAGYQLGILSNVDDDLLAETRKHFTVPIDLIVTAQQVRLLQAGRRALHDRARAHRRASVAARGPEPLPRRDAVQAPGRAGGLDQSRAARRAASPGRTASSPPSPSWPTGSPSRARERTPMALEQTLNDTLTQAIKAKDTPDRRRGAHAQDQGAGAAHRQGLRGRGGRRPRARGDRGLPQAPAESGGRVRQARGARRRARPPSSASRSTSASAICRRRWTTRGCARW